MDFSEDQIQRYARHILLPEVGGEGQARLLNSKVLVIGAGGLGSPALLYLAAAGVGTIGIVDDDVVDLSNLQRQVVHWTGSIGRPKVESAAETLAAINPEVDVIAHDERISAANALELISAYDVVADGSDNFPTRFLVNDACYFAGKTLVSAAILRRAVEVRPCRGAGGGACHRARAGWRPPPGQLPSGAEAGGLGGLGGMGSSLQATEVLKELLGIGESLAGYLLICDGLNTTFRKIKVKRDPGCPLCGDAPVIKDLSIHEPR